MKLNPEKYNRKITLLCPICGNSEMEHVEESEMVKCTDCGNETSKDEFIQENGQNIDAQIDEIKKELSKDTRKQLNDIFKKAFKGSKNIRIK